LLPSVVKKKKGNQKPRKTEKNFESDREGGGKYGSGARRSNLSKRSKLFPGRNMKTML